MPNSLGSRLLYLLEQTVELFIGSLTVLSLVIAEAWSLFYVGTIGIFLVLFRNWFMANAQALANQSMLITDSINLLIGTVNVIGDIIGLLISFVGGIASLFSGGPPGFPQFVPTTIPLVNSTSFEQACIELPRVCAGVDTPGKLFELAILPTMSNQTCGFFRYLYPTGWLFDVLYPIGKATYLTYPPFPPGTGPNTTEFGNNCACPSGCSYQWQCIALGSGYWLLEFVLPLILFGCVWQGWIEHVLRIGAALLVAVAVLLRRLVAIPLIQLGRIVTIVDRAVGAITARVFWKSARRRNGDTKKTGGRLGVDRSDEKSRLLTNSESANWF